MHEDGSLVSTASPARHGETVAVLATGLGPYERTAPDGFLLSEDAGFQTADPVDILLADQVLQPVYSGATGYGVGVQAVRFQIGQDSVISGTLELKVRVNGHESNTVLLPVE